MGRRDRTLSVLRQNQTETVAIDKLELNGGTQSRAGLNDAKVEEYKDLYLDGVTLPPIKATNQGEVRRPKVLAVGWLSSY